MAPVAETSRPRTPACWAVEISGEPEAVEEQEEHIDDGMGAEEEHHRPRVVRDPGQPTPEEVEAHNVTHIPYRPWCEACNRGKAKKKPSLRLCGAYAQSCHARVRMDYAKLTEVVESEADEEEND